jgi:hypothetical protein
MPKPICIIYFPENTIDGAGEGNWIYEYMRYLNGEQSNGNEKWEDRKDYWSDYYWFCFYKYDIQEPQIQVFHEKDFTEIQYKELKQLIISHLPKQKTTA